MIIDSTKGNILTRNPFWQDAAIGSINAALKNH